MLRLQTTKILALIMMAFTAGLVSCGNNGGGGSTPAAVAPVNTAACSSTAGYVNGYPGNGYQAGYPGAVNPYGYNNGYQNGYQQAYPYGATPGTNVVNPWASCAAGQVPVCNGGALTCVAQTQLTNVLGGYRPAIYGYPYSGFGGGGYYNGGGLGGGYYGGGIGSNRLQSYGYIGFGFGYLQQANYATLAACNPYNAYSCGSYGRCVPSPGLGFGGVCVQ